MTAPNQPSTAGIPKDSGREMADLAEVDQGRVHPTGTRIRLAMADVRNGHVRVAADNRTGTLGRPLDHVSSFSRMA
jgi:hypothetical protein